MFEKALDLDSKFAPAYAQLGHAYLFEWVLGWERDSQSLEKAFELAEKAIALDGSLDLGHCLLGQVYLWKKQHDRAIAVFETSINLNPNYAMSYAGLGEILSWAGRPQEAIQYVKKAMRLNPNESWYLWNLGHAYFLMGRNDDAIKALKGFLTRSPDFLPAHVYLAASYSELGRQEEARAEAAEIVRLRPQTSAETLRNRLPYKDRAVSERIFDALRKAGLKQP
jgi:adenylate cyclase